jgi:hypothetical protein
VRLGSPGSCCRPVGNAPLAVRMALLHRLRDKANSKNRPFGFVQKPHLPFSVLLEVTRNAADEIAANAGQFCPSCIVVGKLGATVRRAGKTAISDAEKIERHGEKPMLRLRPLKACRKTTPIPNIRSL